MSGPFLTWRRLRVLEASAALLVSRVLLRTLPFSRLSAFMGRVDAASVEDSSRQAPRHSGALAVGRAVERAGLLLPWPSTCLVRALAGHLMLRRRGLPSSVVFGLSKPNGELLAHAWLMAFNGAVCGGDEAVDYIPIATFRPHSLR